MNAGASCTTLSVTNVDQELIGSNPKRRTLLISSPSAGQLRVSFQGPSGGATDFLINPGTSAMEFPIEKYGVRVRDAWRCQLTVVGPANVGVIEVVDP